MSMIILKILKWFSFLFTGIMAIIIGLIFILPLFEQKLSINESTKTCVITGASQGIGKSIAVEMIKRGWKVIGIARNENELRKVHEELGSLFIPYKCDVSKYDQVVRVSEEIKRQQLKPTLFFLNAALSTDPLEKWQSIFDLHKKTIETNYLGVISWVDEWLNNVKEWGGGTFVVISSVNAIFAGSESASTGYGASKAAISSAFRSLRFQYYDDKISFVDVLPGPVDTQGLEEDRETPFIHQPEEEARYIVQQVFKGKQHIEPSWYWSYLVRLLTFLPDKLRVRALD